jgi:Uri superfamily endonuclease
MRLTYCLIIFFKGGRIEIGNLGFLNLKKGYYIYVGSAPSFARIERHYRKRKKIKWHIDYLLRRSSIIGFSLSKEKECDAAKKISKNFQSVNKFGCSDCNCRSHLFYSVSLRKIEDFLG